MFNLIIDVISDCHQYPKGYTWVQVHDSAEDAVKSLNLYLENSGKYMTDNRMEAVKICYVPNPTN